MVRLIAGLDTQRMTSMTASIRTLADSHATVRWLGLTTAGASLLTAGSLFAFSTFVMPALHRLSASSAVAAMQSINIIAPKSLLMLPLVGGAIGSVLVGLFAVVRPDLPNRGWLIAGALLGLAPMVITAIYSQPHNLELGTVSPTGTGAAAAWAHYYGGWMVANHLRVVAGVASSIALATGVLRR